MIILKKKKIRILIADDNIDFLEIIKTHFDSKENIEVVSTAIDGFQAYEEILKTKPDLVLLDVIMPHLDGLGVIEKLNSNTDRDFKRPKIVIISAVGQDIITKKAVSLGAEYYILKPFDLNLLTKRVLEIMNLDKNNYQKIRNTRIIDIDTDTRITDYSNTDTDMIITDDDEFNMSSLERVISKLMHELGIPANIKGHNYLRSSIKKAVENIDIIGSITKELYPLIASEFETTSTRVERSIRHAIEVAWERGKVEMLEEIFGYTVCMKKGKPTNSEFIAMIADRLRIEIAENLRS